MGTSGWWTGSPSSWRPADRDARPSPELFDLEWRLDEIGQYATWFEGVHSDSQSDRVALDGLLAELAR